MDPTHDRTSEPTRLRDRFLAIRRPWRDVWAGMLSAPVGAALTLGIGAIAHAYDPCQGLACLWVWAVLIVALYVLGAWVVIAGLTWVAERVGLSPVGTARTVRGLAVVSWLAVLSAGGTLVLDLTLGI